MAVTSRLAHTRALTDPHTRTNSRLWWSLCLFFIFVLLYEPVLVATGTGVLSIVLILSLFASLVYGKRVDLSYEFLSVPFLLIASFALIVGTGQLLALARGEDQFFLRVLVSTCAAYVPTSFFVARTLGHTGDALGTTLRMLAWACFFQSVFVILDWAVPAANSLFTRIVAQPDLVEVSYRVAGLSSSTGDGLSFRQALGAMAALHLSVVSPVKSRQIWWVGVVCLCLLSMVFIGRTGVVLFLVFAVGYGLTTPLKKSIARSLLVFLTMYSIVGTIGVLLMPTSLREMLFHTVLPQAFEFVFSYSTEGRFSVGTLDVILKRMIFVPESVSTLLLGDGYWSNPIGPGNYVPSDVGYVRSIYYVGVIGSLMVYLWYGFLWHLLHRTTLNPSTKAFVNGAFVALFLAQAKFPFLYSSTTLTFCFLLYFSSHIDCYRRDLLVRRVRELYDTEIGPTTRR